MARNVPSGAGALSAIFAGGGENAERRADKNHWRIQSRVTNTEVRAFSFLGAGSVALASRGPWLPRSPSPGGTPRMSTRVPRSRSASRGRSFPGGPTTVRVRPRAILGNWMISPRPQLECRGCPILTPIPSPDLPSRRPQVPVRRQQRHRIPARDPWGARALGAGQLRRGRSHP